MTEQKLERHRKWCRLRYGIDGEDIFHQAWIYAQGYGGIEKVNQSLFSKLCRWAAREIRKHEKYEIPFSCLQTENEDREEFAEFDFADPTWAKQYIAIEEREEVAKTYGQWLLNALLSATEPKPARKEEEKEEEQLQFEFVA
jgi:succinate dehydrogenase/fumarate reductase flavoprotein subunit